MSANEGSHVPVMLTEVVAALAPRPGDLIADGTYGAGGYARALLEAGAEVIGFDRDPDVHLAARPAIAAAGGRLRLIKAPFSTLADHLEPSSLDGLVLDVGVSSMQIDQPQRGFSFLREGPLDMRMAQSGLGAGDVVNTFDVKQLIRIIGILGEERNAPRIARAIVAARQRAPIETTGQLAALVEAVMPRTARPAIHPATRTFQGLRIFVNDELGELARALFAAETCLKAGGRLVVVSFHSLEDRIVKRFIQDRSANRAGSRHLPASAPQPLVFSVEGRAVIGASRDEIETNPRARSAKLRAAIRTQAAPRKPDMDLFRLPDLPWPGVAGDERP